MVRSLIYEYCTNEVILNTLYKVILFGLFLVQFACVVAADEVDEFITKVNVSTFDCPADSSIPQLENYLKNSRLSAEQVLRLKVHKAHWLICVGNNDEAKTLIEKLLLDKNIDKTSRSYASIHYQLGFIFDVNDDPRKCEYYRKSLTLAKDKFSDLHLSSQLGLITECDKDSQNIGIKLGRLFALIETYTAKNDDEALAHIHNNIGLLYSSMGQRALAAEQYEKSYRIGLSVYEEKNQLAPLISVISALTGGGDFENAKRMIEELGEGNRKVNTPLTNSWYHFALSRHYYYVGDFEAMRKSLKAWNTFLESISNKEMYRLYEWYSTALCLNDGNKACVSAFLEKQKDPKTALPSRLAKHSYYLNFLVKAHLFMGDIQAASVHFDHYVSIVNEKMRVQQTSARVLGVANLHNKIIDLEINLAESEQRRWHAVLVILGAVLCIALLAYVTVGRAYLRKLATDPVTGLLSEQAVLAKIKKVKSPSTDHVNALALFDIRNMGEIDTKHGYVGTAHMLKLLAGYLLHATRDIDLVGRVSAGQFIVCLQNIEEATARDSFTRIEKALLEPVIISESGKNIEANIMMHIYNASTELSDVDDVLSEIRRNLSDLDKAK